MSHTTTMKQKVTNIDLFCNVAQEQGHTVEMAKAGQTMRVQHYGNNAVDAQAQVHMQNWKYPIAITKSGEIMYDHWGSAANTIEHLGSCWQEYNRRLISDSIPFDEIENWTTKKVANGDVIITLEY